LDRHLHIVTLEIPYPVNYGGVVDLFYKLKYLHAQGVKIHLHCFTNDRQPQQELNKYCVEITYYKRKSNANSFSLSLPLIVKSRINDELLTNLQKDNYSILLEGIHCSYYLYKNLLPNRKVVVRLHNVEFEYYKHLAKHEKNWFKKLYFLHESYLLKKYEKKLAQKAPVLTVSQQDADLYTNLFKAPWAHFLPVFIPHTLAVGNEGTGVYCLYHGNLSISENEAAVTWLLQNVFNDVKIPFVIAGKNPSKKLENLAHAHTHTCIVANPGDSEMQDMISKAQIHVLPSFNNTGIKLKLLNALFNGRFCLVNNKGVNGSGLESVVQIANSATEFKAALQVLFNQPFGDNEKQQRQGLLLRKYNNEENAKMLTTFLW
jgi:hypothetical protein